MNKYVKIGCLSIFGIFVLMFLFPILFPETFERWQDSEIAKQKVQRDSARYEIDLIIKRMQLANSKLPLLEKASLPKKYPQQKYISWLSTSVSELAEYRADGFYAKGFYEPWRTRDMQVIEEAYPKLDSGSWDEVEVRKACKFILKATHLAVYQPLTYQPPYLVEKESFVPG